ncbi:MAG: tRNA pseudouridine(13) synthase TruD [Natronospirillum sp.]|uniref:tRNA pseudouridine(13) synthase TruD n=1 Tax=Natronospirillum sp. TaxID=2812955 RepID=UPI0025ED3AF5|nr:tRNA pseudouridine(13) synthase TruD [Natronospirillum sp.]MCH8551608.1 tRNA pseudouridine(13) synthase TruD [Natronospirillum sp.]
MTETILPTAWGEPLGSALLRSTPEDFVVIEHLDLPPPAAPGQREHLWLCVEKRGANTGWVARQLAEALGVRARHVGYAGRKDRHALTRQWFSVYLPGRADREPLPEWPEHAEFRIIDSRWANRKLRRGQHLGNRFLLTLRDWTPDQDQLSRRLADISNFGVPNYFGPQRFGHEFRPEPKPIVWSAEREARGFQISAMRSHLFNLQLAARVHSGDWRSVRTGEWLAWRGSAAGFLLQEPEARIDALFAAGELSPTAWLPGLVRDERLGPAATEREMLADWSVWIDQLCERRVECARRPTVLVPENLAAQPTPDGTGWQLAFDLPPGGFATTIVQALCETRLTDQPEEVQD